MTNNKKQLSISQEFKIINNTAITLALESTKRMPLKGKEEVNGRYINNLMVMVEMYVSRYGTSDDLASSKIALIIYLEKMLPSTIPPKQRINIFNDILTGDYIKDITRT